MSSKTSPPASSAGRQVRTKDKLKHSRNETRRRARIRDQFDGLKQAIQCDKKDRYNILQFAVEVVQGYQLRIAQLEQVVAKYEANTKLRFYAAPMILPLVQQGSAKRQRLATKTASRRRNESDSEEEFEEERSEEEEEEENASDSDGDQTGEPVQSRPQSTAVRQTALQLQLQQLNGPSTGVTHSVGSTLSSNLTSAAPTTAVTSGTNSAAVNVLATLASAATVSSTSSDLALATVSSSTTVHSPNGEPRKVAKRLTGVKSSSDTASTSSAPSTGSAGSRKRKLTDSAIDSLHKTEAVGIQAPIVAPLAMMATNPSLAYMSGRSGTSPLGASSLSAYSTMIPPMQSMGGMMQQPPAWSYNGAMQQQQSMQSAQAQQQAMQQKFMQQQHSMQQPYFGNGMNGPFFPNGAYPQHMQSMGMNQGMGMDYSSTPQQQQYFLPSATQQGFGAVPLSASS